MLHEATIHSNGVNGIHANGHTLDCHSDYEPRQADAAPLPGWRNAFPKFTHYIEWHDADGRKHGLTVRCDDRDELLDTLRCVKGATARGDAEPQAETPAEAQPDTQRCAIHSVDMARRWSKRTNGHYFAHKLADGSFCYGRAK